ncbi:Sirohydrochlorin cobaltochelatase [Burkholderiales bacterium 8X]|nr:Sirohydrochlorin cobaltochelatase [Burkholderiales bacterium 8X]
MTHDRLGFLLFAHGSRDERWRAPVEAVAARIAALQPGARVRAAYLEFVKPTLAGAAAELVAAGAEEIRIVPLFLGVGKHLREDLPTLVDALCAEHPGVRFVLREAVGEAPEVVDLLARLALRD